MDDMTDRYGRPYHPLIHEANGDGSPRIGKTTGKLACKRGAQGRDGEAAYAKLVDAGDAPGPARPPGEPRRDRGSMDRHPGPVVPGEPTGAAGGDRVGAVGDGDAAADAGGDRVEVDDVAPWIPDEAGGSGGSAAAGDGDGGGWGRVWVWVGVAAFFAIGVIGGARWRTTPAQDRQFGLEPGSSRWAGILQWAKHRLWDERARDDMRAGLRGIGRLIGWGRADDGDESADAGTDAGPGVSQAASR